MNKSLLLSTIIVLTISIVEHDCDKKSLKKRGKIQHFYSYEPVVSKTEYDLFLGKVLGTNVEYPAVVVSGVAVAAPGVLLKNWELATFCLGFNETGNTKCTAFNRAFENGGIGYFMSPVTPNFTKDVSSKISKGPVHNMECITISHKHSAVPVLYRDSWEVDCSGCEFLDAMFCNDKIVGVLLEGIAGAHPVLLYSEMQEFALRKIGSDASDELWNSFPLIGQARKARASQIDISDDVINMSLIVMLLFKYIYTSLI